MGTHQRILSKNFQMNTNKQGLDGFQNSLHDCALDKSSFSIEGLKGERCERENEEREVYRLEACTMCG